MTIVVTWLIVIDSNNELKALNDLVVEQRRVIDLQQQYILDLEASGDRPVIRKPTAKVVVTAYTPCKKECDSDPYVTASMQRVRPGIVAVSRDLFWNGWTFGKKVYVEGHGVLEIADLMNERYSNRVDVFVWTKKEARRIGVKEAKATLVEQGG